MSRYPLRSATSVTIYSWSWRQFALALAAVLLMPWLTVFAQALDDRAEQFKRVDEALAALDRADRSSQRLLSILEGMASLEMTPSQDIQYQRTNSAYERLASSDCRLNSALSTLTLYNGMTHEPDRRRAQGYVQRTRDLTVDAVTKSLDRVEKVWIAKLAGTPAAAAAMDAVREQRRAVAAIKAYTF